jgi:hypothetical protein
MVKAASSTPCSVELFVVKEVVVVDVDIVDVVDVMISGRVTGLSHVSCRHIH